MCWQSSAAVFWSDLLGFFALLSSVQANCLVVCSPENRPVCLFFFTLEKCYMYPCSTSLPTAFSMALVQCQSISGHLLLHVDMSTWVVAVWPSCGRENCFRFLIFLKFFWLSDTMQEKCAYASAWSVCFFSLLPFRLYMGLGIIRGWVCWIFFLSGLIIIHEIKNTRFVVTFATVQVSPWAGFPKDDHK